jgi:Flp pilus assembly CpaF family ATPase
MLRTALGPAICAFLEDAAVVEVMLNPDGRLWIDRLSGSLEGKPPAKAVLRGDVMSVLLRS